MKLMRNIGCLLVCLLAGLSRLNAQLYKIDLQTKINKSALIVEGQVTGQHSFWNNEHTVIYTSNTVHVYKLFKGRLVANDIEIITLGGSVGDVCLKVSDVLQLKKHETGMFFLNENSLKVQSPVTKNILFDVYSSKQGFLSYDKNGKVATAPFAKYENIEATLYKEMKQQPGLKNIVIDNSVQVSSGTVSNGTTAIAITSFSPATVHAGALNDAANNVLTINGSGFENNPSGSAGVQFKDANSSNAAPEYEVAYNSPYILSWTDTKITLMVPERAATGNFSVVTSDGSSATSASSLQVFFAILDAEFSGGTVVREPRLMNTNGSGGYTIQFSTSTAGGGKDFTASPAKETFMRALTTWKEITGLNFIIGSSTTQQKVADDNVNIVAFDNNNTGVPNMADGVLESTFSWFKACLQGSQVLTAQKTGFDILLRNDAVSTGGKISFENGPCFPAVGSYDLEMIILHELGHALNLGHINDDFENENGGYPSINPSKLMHYSILDYANRRSPDVAAYQGALYAITPQNNNYSSCGLFSQELIPLPATTVANDDCPANFPAAALEDNTTVAFDLVHATSNKFVDPSYKQVNCKNTGTSVTNNVYYAFMTGNKTAIDLDIKDFTTAPADLVSCDEQGIRLALYDVQSCPEGQSFPSPVTCQTFTGNTTITLSGLQQNHKYLLYFDGLRNTKATFNIVFNSDGSNPSEATIDVFPNPVESSNLRIRITNPSGASYQYALFDAVGKQLQTGTITTNQSVQTYLLGIKSVVPGVYFLKLVDANGKTVLKKKILKLTQ